MYDATSSRAQGTRSSTAVHRKVGGRALFGDNERMRPGARKLWPKWRVLAWMAGFAFGAKQSHACVSYVEDLCSNMLVDPDSKLDKA